MRACFATLLCLLVSLFLASSGIAKEPPAEVDAELKWAEGVALDFLNAAAQGDLAQAEALIGPTLKDAYSYSESPTKLRDWLNNTVSIRRPGKPQFESRTLSPGGHEAAFRGAFVTEDRSSPFTLRIAKEKGGDTWLVNFFRVHAAVDASVKAAPVSPIPAVRARPKTPAQLLFGQVPAKLSVYVVACHEGEKELDVSLGDETVAVRLNEIVVNRPDEDVVLVLSSYNATIWRIGVSKGTRIAGVLLTGYEEQAVVGLDDDVPQVSSTVRRRGAFTPFHFSDILRDAAMIEKVVQQALGQAPLEIVHQSRQGVFRIGSSVAAKDVLYPGKKVEEVSEPLKVPRGEKGLQQLLAEKKIRQAKQADIDAWVEKAQQNPKLVGPNLQADHHMRLERTFVVLAETAVPGGLHGGHSASFIIPEGTPAPTGDRGHSTYYFMDGTRLP